MSTRVRINLAVFALLFFVLVWWDITNVLRPDMVTNPYKIKAEFETSPGLRKGFAVTYLGVKVGELGYVKLVGGHVETQLKIDPDVKLPATLDAAVRRKSVVGEPYVDLRPTGGTDPGGARVKPGAVIPMSRTTTPLLYSTLFNSVGRLLDAVPTDDLRRLLSASAIGLEGRGDDIRKLITSSEQLTGTFAKNTPLLDKVADDLTTFTHTLAEHRQSIGTGFDNVASLSQMLADNKDRIVSLLQHSPTLLADVNQLLTTSGPDIGCTIDAMGGLFHTLNQPAIIDSFYQMIALSGQTAFVLRSVGFQGPDGPYLKGTNVYTVGEPPARLFKNPLQLPAVTPLPVCRAPRATGAGGQGAPTAPGAGGAQANGEHGVHTPGRQGPAKPSAGPSSKKPSKGVNWRDYLLPALIGLLALALIVTGTMLRPWQRLKGFR